MRKHYFVPINGVQWLTYAVLICMLAGFFYGFSQLRATSAELARTQKQLAHTQAHQGDGLRAVLCFADHAIRVRPGIPHAQRVEAERFYERALKRAHLRPCQ